MRIIIIRHADPDYAVDNLTPVGKCEAQLLAQRLIKTQIDDIYCSILGRAKATIAPYLELSGKTAEYKEWLREFDVPVKIPYLEKEKSCWDLLPDFVNRNPVLYDPENWHTAEFIKQSNLFSEYNRVCNEFDTVLAKNGYIRQGVNYNVQTPNHKTLVFCCHYGVGSVLLSHILNCSPYTLWQNTVLLPSSVTEIYTEERRAGTASLRACAIGDTSHLFAGGNNPSFAARFCECFGDGTRHD